MTNFIVEPPTFEYELCEQCESNMQKAGVFGQTVQEMFEQQTTFYFDLAFILLSEGNYLIRTSEKEKEFPKVIALIETKDSCEENKHYEFACVDLETDKVEAYLTLTSQDILADDWTIAKVKEKEGESK
jgi:hypothetical protein